ncbi:recombination protein O N-terminal domain-containing protein [Novosphingobium flavum]|uniref:Recombination protein O N-terminal domain-containing protein n=1 Tax=Novosphingobium flavum TaxID=1778672 RepID=A0A7X1FRB9_9SPHN|nr:recombination protein O N-terminal domain-containing protein [Novosphingobium flavum]MBC2665545.1 recombination protein O N-terminal domain-containing protein [Novosphingobium flavum]
MTPTEPDDAEASREAIVCAVRPHGETAVIVRLLTAQSGLVAAYVAGGRGRQLRPVLIPGNSVAAEWRARSESQLPFARIELAASRAPFLTEPLPAAAIDWATALTAAALPERQPFPALHEALSALLDAVCHAPSARGWLPAMVSYEALLLRDLGYGAPPPFPPRGDFSANLALLDRLGPALARYPLATCRSDVMAARALLRERLGRME